MVARGRLATSVAMAVVEPRGAPALEELCAAQGKRLARHDSSATWTLPTMGTEVRQWGAQPTASAHARGRSAWTGGPPGMGGCGRPEGAAPKLWSGAAKGRGCARDGGSGAAARHQQGVAPAGAAGRLRSSDEHAHGREPRDTGVDGALGAAWSSCSEVGGDTDASETVAARAGAHGSRRGARTGRSSEHRRLWRGGAPRRGLGTGQRGAKERARSRVVAGDGGVTLRPDNPMVEARQR